MSNPVTWLLDWLLIHLVALGFVLFLIVAIIWRGPLFGINAAEKEAILQVQPAVESIQQVVDEIKPAVKEIPSQEGIQSHYEEVVSDDSAIFRPAKAVKPDSKSVQLTHAGELKSQKRSGPPKDEPVLDDAEVQELLQEARAAFWNGTLEKAEKLYLQYLKQRPEDAYGFGELGNLFQSMGKNEDALDAYYEAGVRFKALGDNEQLDQILELLDETNDRRAMQLR